jgi:NAD(P)-dependent dehydrogenase (short-subunit alcohol dehydrogenase family)
LASARALAERRATVVMVSRDPARAEAARRQAGARAETEIADLSSVEATRALAAQITAHHPRVDALVNNAGLSLFERRASCDGHEYTFAVNVLSGFVLTHLLAKHIPRGGRVVHMTSAAAYTQRLDVDALLAPPTYRGAIQYAQTKRAQIELNTVWIERLAPLGVTSTCVHPGLARTPGVEVAAPLYHRLAGPLLRDPDQGADTAVWLAASPAAAGRSGGLWFDRAPRPEHVFPWTRSPRAEADRLFSLCAKLGGVAS